MAADCSAALHASGVVPDCVDTVARDVVVLSVQYGPSHAALGDILTPALVSQAESVCWVFAVWHCVSVCLCLCLLQLYACLRLCNSRG